MNQSQITLNAELIDNEIVIRLTSHNDNQDLANKAARKLFVSLEDSCPLLVIQDGDLQVTKFTANR